MGESLEKYVDVYRTKDSAFHQLLRRSGHSVRRSARQRARAARLSEQVVLAAADVRLHASARCRRHRRPGGRPRHALDQLQLPSRQQEPAAVQDDAGSSAGAARLQRMARHRHGVHARHRHDETARLQATLHCEDCARRRGRHRRVHAAQKQLHPPSGRIRRQPDVCGEGVRVDLQPASPRRRRVPVARLGVQQYRAVLHARLL